MYICLRYISDIGFQLNLFTLHKVQSLSQRLCVLCTWAVCLSLYMGCALMASFVNNIFLMFVCMCYCMHCKFNCLVISTDYRCRKGSFYLCTNNNNVNCYVHVCVCMYVCVTIRRRHNRHNSTLLPLIMLY